MTCIHPRQFVETYVKSAHIHFRRNSNEPHLAIHAIAQFDVLSEVVAIWLRQAGALSPKRGALKSYRDEQGQHEPSLALVRDIHDSHKHGRLGRKGNVLVTQGQRPFLEPDYYIIIGAVTEYGGPVKEVESVNIVLDDGTTVRMRWLLDDAWSAWQREFSRLKVSPL